MLGHDENYKELFEVLKIMVASHGNAQIESWLSLNSNLIVENMSKESVVAQRQVATVLKH